MSAVQIECHCLSCGKDWYFLPFEEARLARADLMRYEVRGRSGGWNGREPRMARSSGCGCGNGGCLFLEGFACAELLDGCGCGGCGGAPFAIFGALTALAPFTHLWMRITRTKPAAHHRECPSCGSGLFERRSVLYAGPSAEQTINVSIQLPVPEPFVPFSPQH